MNPLKEVLIISEAAFMWNLDTSTLRKAILKEKHLKGKHFREDEYSKTEPGGVIKILRTAMIRLYGEPDK